MVFKLELKPQFLLKNRTESNQKWN